MQFLTVLCFVGFLSSEYCDRYLSPSTRIVTKEESLVFQASQKISGTCLQEPDNPFEDLLCPTLPDKVIEKAVPTCQRSHDDAGVAGRPTNTEYPAARPGHIPYKAATVLDKPPPTTTPGGLLTTVSDRMPLSTAAVVGQQWEPAKPTDVLSYATRPYSGHVTIDPVSATTTDSPRTYTTKQYSLFDEELQIVEGNVTIVYVTIRTYRKQQDGSPPTKMSLIPTTRAQRKHHGPAVTDTHDSIPRNRAARPGAAPRILPRATTSPQQNPVAMPIVVSS